MSAKVKKRFEEMQTYLGRDTEGLKKLKLLKDDVNELRTGLAAAKEQLEQMVAIKDAARERADAAEAKLAKVALERDTAKQLLVSESQKVAAVEAQLAKLAEDDVTADEAVHTVSNTAGYRSVLWRHPDAARVMITQLRQRLKYCPSAIAEKQGDARSTRYRRDSLASGWTHTDIWTLGAAVAAITSMIGTVTIESDERLTTDNELYDIDKKTQTRNRTHSNFYLWFERYNLHTKHDRKSLQPAQATHLTNVQKAIFGIG